MHDSTIDDENLNHYKDMEWRIVDNDNLENSQDLECRNQERYLNLRNNKDKIECIVFPNDNCCRECMDIIKSTFEDTCFPIISTLNRIKHL